jgi:hypothetical protein
VVLVALAVPVVPVVLALALAVRALPVALAPAVLVVLVVLALTALLLANRLPINNRPCAGSNPASAASPGRGLPATGVFSLSILILILLLM